MSNEGVKWQLLELVLSFYHVGSGDQTWVLILVASAFTHWTISPVLIVVVVAGGGMWFVVN